jgi:hypothetical protein
MGVTRFASCWKESLKDRTGDETIRYPDILHGRRLGNGEMKLMFLNFEIYLHWLLHSWNICSIALNHTNQLNLPNYAHTSPN